LRHGRFCGVLTAGINGAICSCLRDDSFLQALRSCATTSGSAGGCGAYSFAVSISAPFSTCTSSPVRPKILTASDCKALFLHQHSAANG